MKQNVPSKEYESIVQAIRQSVNTDHGVSLTCICLIETKTIIKTTSGKISRSKCKQAYQNNSLHILYKWEGDINQNNDNNVPEIEIRDGEYIDATSNNNSTTTTNNNNTTTQDGENNNTKTKKTGGTGPLPKFTREEARSLEITEINKLIETVLINVSAQSPSPLVGPLDHDTSLVGLGLDSFSVVQFKGVLEKRYDYDDDYYITVIIIIIIVTIFIVIFNFYY